MRKLTRVFFVFLCVLDLSGCGYKEGVRVTDRKAYLYFTGNTGMAEVRVGDQAFTLGENVTTDDLFQIVPGQHRIEVRQGGRTVVDRQIYVAEGNSREIQIPAPL